MAHPLLFNCWAVSTKHQLLRRQRELCKTSNGKVFMVEVGVSA